MRLLKIGTLNIPSDRWEDALDFYSEIHVVCFDTEKEINNNRIKYVKINSANLINKVLFYALKKSETIPSLAWFCEILLFALRIYNYPVLSQIRNTDYSAIHSSYNDFDESALLTCILNPNTYIRAQKETRLQYSYLEKRAFEKATTVILNDELNLEFYRKKYGKKFLMNSQVMFGLDEDVRSQRVFHSFQYSKKLSDIDGRIHAVILAGRVLSNPNEPRSGGRLYYINLINSLIDSGIVVHLYTGKIIPYNGVDLYHELAKNRKEFIIEGVLDFVNDRENAYRTLSQYDIGVCHAHLPEAEVTVFDKVNIPHRYYEYQIAHVVPFDLRGCNLLLEKKAEQNHALICNNYSEISFESIRKIQWETNSFAEYIYKIYFNQEYEKGNE